MHERSSLPTSWRPTVHGSLCSAARLIDAIRCGNVVVDATAPSICRERNANPTLVLLTTRAATSPGKFHSMWYLFQSHHWKMGSTTTKLYLQKTVYQH